MYQQASDRPKARVVQAMGMLFVPIGNVMDGEYGSKVNSDHTPYTETHEQGTTHHWSSTKQSHIHHFCESDLQMLACDIVLPSTHYHQSSTVQV